MKKYNLDYLNELVTEVKTKGFYSVINNYIYDTRLYINALSYVDKLLTETEKCGIQNQYKDAEDYYYQMATHCFAAGLIISDFFSQNELNDDTFKKCLDRLLLSDTIVTANRVANIKNLEEMEMRSSYLFDLSLVSLKTRWDGKFDNNNADVIAVLMLFVFAGSCEELNRYRYEEDSSNKSEVYWRDENGKIRCLGDDCIYEKCPDDCPIWKNSIAIQIMQRGYCEKAIPYLLEATKIAPDFRDLWINLGNCYGNVMQYEYAYNAFKTAYEIDNKYGNTIYFLALTAKNLNKKEEALKWCEIYDSLFKDNRCKSIKESCKGKKFFIF